MMAPTIAVLTLLLFALPASAKDPHAFDSQHFSSHEAQRDYFNGLTNSNKNEAQPERPTGGLCCSFADGKRLEDPDWTAGIEVKGQKCVYAEDDERNQRTGSQYCVRVDGVWYQVPDSALVAQKNIIGVAEVWPFTTIGTPSPLVARYASAASCLEREADDVDHSATIVLPAENCSGEPQSVRAKTCSKAAMKWCHPALAPW